MITALVHSQPVLAASALETKIRFREARKMSQVGALVAVMYYVLTSVTPSWCAPLTLVAHARTTASRPLAPSHLSSRRFQPSPPLAAGAIVGLRVHPRRRRGQRQRLRHRPTCRCRSPRLGRRDVLVAGGAAA